MTYQNLILIPTSYEQRLGATQLDSLATAMDGQVHLCGLGLVHAGINTTQMVHRLQPRCVWLLGIAGTYLGRLQIGEAYEFSQVGCYGVGVGSGVDYQSPIQLGWAQSLSLESTDMIHLNDLSPRRQLLSVVAASAGPAEAELKIRHFSEAEAEDMESFAVALACQTLGVPLRIIRGISNQVGERNHQRWLAAEAMQAAIRLTSQLRE